MKPGSVISFYLPRKTVLHEWHIGIKLSLLIVYAMTIWGIASARGVVGILCGLSLVSLALKLPLCNRLAVVISIMLLTVSLFLPEMMPMLLLDVFISFAKVVSFLMLVSLFTMTTRPSQILQYLAQGNPKSSSVIQSSLYLLNTMIAVFPSLEYDLQRAIEAERIRLGHKVGITNFDSWLTVLIVVLVRILKRSERFADSVIDRGFSPGAPVTTLRERSMGVRDFWVFICAAAPCILIWVWPR